MDTSKPIVTSCPENITQVLPTNAATTGVYWKPPEAIDLSADMLTVDQSHNPGDKFHIGTTQVVYEFTDSARNSATCRFSVTIKPGDYRIMF